MKSRNLALAAGLSLCCASSLAASPGDLDSQFGSGGTQSYFTFVNNYTIGLAVTSDDSIYVTSDLVGATAAAVLTRLNADGSIDNNFGEFYSTDVGSVIEDTNRIFLVPAADGGVYFAGIVTSDPEGDAVRIGKVQANGELAFSELTNLDLGGTSGIFNTHRFEVVPGGGFLVSGFVHNAAVDPDQRDAFMFRFDSNGVLDAAFNSLKLHESDQHHIRDQIVTNDGDIYALGWDYDSTSGVMKSWLRRYDASGNPDAAFGTGGKVVFDPATDIFVPEAMQLHSNGNIRLVGETATESAENTAESREYLGDGTLDTSFGNGGRVVVSTPNENIHGVLFYTDGSALLLSNTVVGAMDNDEDFVFRQLDHKGDLDTSFGSNGVVTLDYAFLDNAWRAERLSDGRVFTWNDLFSDEFTTMESFAIMMQGVERDFLPDMAATVSEANVETDSLITFAPVEVKGVSPGAMLPISIDNGEFSVSGSGQWQSGSRTIVAGESFSVRHTSASGTDATATSEVTIGGYAHEDGEHVIGEQHVISFTSRTKPAGGSSGGESGGGGGGSLFWLLLAAILFRPLHLARRR